jgi:hypothetical protein
METGPVVCNHPTKQTALFEKHISPQPQTGLSHNLQTRALSTSSAFFHPAECFRGPAWFGANFPVFLDLLNESGQFPHARTFSERRMFTMGASLSAFAKFIK